MISAYPASASVWPGERLVLHVATDQPRFRVQFLRWADGPVPVMLTGWLNGEAAPGRGADDDWRWPAYSFEVPEDWPSAVYLAHLCVPDAASFSLAQTDAAALFVVRGKARSGLLYKLPLATYHAYNVTGGGCFYFNQPRSDNPPGTRVSFQRPGGGIGGATWGAPDHYDASSPRQTFAHWDARFIGWLTRNGYSPEFCTDLDIHDDPALCQRYRLLLSVGHDEYWSEAMRDHVEAFVEQGGNVAFFSANLCWWRVHLVDGGRAMVCHQGGKQGARDHWWPDTGAARPEDSLGGVSYRHGGGWWDGARSATGYRVQQADHWVFASTGLQRGEEFGADSWPPLVGYECDGVPLSRFDADTGTAHVSTSARESGTPAGFVLLAAGLLGEAWQERPPREGCRAGEGIHAAAMGIFSRTGHGSDLDAGSESQSLHDTALIKGSASVAGNESPPSHGTVAIDYSAIAADSESQSSRRRTAHDSRAAAAEAVHGTGLTSSDSNRAIAHEDIGFAAAKAKTIALRGTVFTAGTTDWAQVLDSGHDERVQTITRNVIDRLLAGGPDA